MYPITTQFKQLIKEPNRGSYLNAKILINNVEYKDENIVNITLDETVNPDDGFVLGSVASQKLNLSLINYDNVEISDVEDAIVKPYVGLEVGGVIEYVPLGVFYVEKPIKDKGRLELTCFDNMTKMEKSYHSQLTYPTSINQVALEISQIAGVTLVSDLPNTFIPKMNNVTLRDAISYISAFVGGFARFNRDGELEITSYIDSDEEITADNYIDLTTAENPFVIGKIGCRVPTEGGHVELVTGDGGTGVYFEHPFMTQEQLDLIYDNLKDLVYMPYEMKWQGNPALMAGDKVTITDVNDNVYRTIVMEQQITYTGGLSATAAAKAQTETAQEFSYSGTISDRLEKIEEKQEREDPDITPSKPINLTATGLYENIMLMWNYDGASNVDYYEVYASQTKGFVPKQENLAWQGKTSSYDYYAKAGETWYFLVRGINNHGTAGPFSDEVSADTRKIMTDDILFGSITADLLEENLNLANKLDQGTLDWINEDPLYEIQQSEKRILYDVGNRIGDVLNDISLIDEEMGDLHYQDTQINERIDGLNTTVQNTAGTVNELTGVVDHHTTQISNWEQRAEGFEQSVINVEGDLENAWAEISVFQQTATDLTLSVGEVRADLDGLEIGGRNLANSNNVTTSLATKSGYIYTLTRNGTGNPFIRISGETFEDDTEYVATFKVRKISGTVTTMAGHQVSQGRNVTVFRDGELVNDSSWSTGDRSYPDDNETHSYEVRFKTINDVMSSTTPDWYIQPNRPSYGEDYEVEIWDFQLEKGNKATDWTPAPEDMADRANLISYINLSTEGVRIHGERVHISGQTLIDDAVIGTAAIADLAVSRAHLQHAIIDDIHVNNMSGTKIIAKTIGVDQLNVANLAAITANLGTVTAGILQAGNSNTYFNLNTSELHMANADITLGGGANIDFLSNNNTLKYDLNNRKAGLLVGRSISNTYPFVAMGAVNLGQPLSATDSAGFSGFIANTNAREGEDGIQNSVVGRVFHVRDGATSWDKGFRFDLNSNDPTLSLINANAYNYNLATSSSQFSNIYSEALTFFAIEGDTQGLIFSGGGSYQHSITRRAGTRELAIYPHRYTGEDIFRIRSHDAKTSYRDEFVIKNDRSVEIHNTLNLANPSGASQGVLFGTGSQQHSMTSHASDNYLVFYPQRYSGQDIFRIRSHHQRGSYQNELRILNNGNLTVRGNFQGDLTGNATSANTATTSSRATNADNATRATTATNLSGGSVSATSISGSSLYISGLITSPATRSNSWPDSSANMFVSTSGQFYRTTSARKYKQDIKKIDADYVDNFFYNAIPVQYRAKNAPERGLFYGYIADDVAKIDRRMVDFDEEGNPEGFNYDRVGVILHAKMLIESKRTTILEDRMDEKDLQIQYLQQKVKQQDKKIKQLEEMVA